MRFSLRGGVSIMLEGPQILLMRNILIFMKGYMLGSGGGDRLISNQTVATWLTLLEVLKKC